ncbi:MAG: hypothetical protein K0M56_03515 [Kaistella sp.]|nr:hypothetical protein [Kaistella sp.]
MYLVTFMLSIVFPLTIYDNLKDILNNFKIVSILKAGGLLGFLIFIWLYFYKIHVKVFITEKNITFKCFFKSKQYNFEDLNCYFEKDEFSRYKNYKGLFIVKENKIVERISNFDYSNYEQLKSKLEINECKKVRCNFFDLIKVLFGFEAEISTKNCR